MSPTRRNEICEVVDQVRDWSLEDRAGLAAEILSIPRPSSGPRKITPLKNLLGLLKTDGPPPDDEECQRILEEELLKKHLR